MRILNLHAKIVFLNTATIVIIYLSLNYEHCLLKRQNYVTTI